MRPDAETSRPKICVNVKTMIKYLLPGTATTNTGVSGSVIIRSTALLLAVLIALSWPVDPSAALAIALRSAGGRSRSRLTDDLFMGSRDDFSRKVQPNQSHGCQITWIVNRRNTRTIHGGTLHPLELKCSSSIARRIGS